MTGPLNVTKFDLIPNFILLIFNSYMVGGEIGCWISVYREKVSIGEEFGRQNNRFFFFMANGFI